MYQYVFNPSSTSDWIFFTIAGVSLAPTAALESALSTDESSSEPPGRKNRSCTTLRCLRREKIIKTKLKSRILFHLCVCVCNANLGNHLQSSTLKFAIHRSRKISNRFVIVCFHYGVICLPLTLQLELRHLR